MCGLLSTFDQKLAIIDGRSIWMTHTHTHCNGRSSILVISVNIQNCIDAGTWASRANPLTTRASGFCSPAADFCYSIPVCRAQCHLTEGCHTVQFVYHSISLMLEQLITFNHHKDSWQSTYLPRTNTFTNYSEHLARFVIYSEARARAQRRFC